MPSYRLLGLWALAALATLAGRPARATVVLNLDIHQLVGRADRIFVGKVVATRSYWTPDHQHIVTDATVLVERDVRGTRKGQRIVVRRLGGTVGTIGMRVAGSPILRTEDRVLLFTQKRGGARFVVGMQQGLYRVHIDTGGRPTVNRQLDGLALANPTPTGLRIAAHTTPFKLPLDSMIEQIRKVIGECAKSPARCKGAP